jgi:conserved repeat domain
MLYVSFNQSTAHVGDTVTVTVTADNDGLVDWCPLEIYAPIPSGLQFLSFVIPDKNLQNYDYTTGIWNVYRMKHTARGQLKTLIITTKVKSGTEGKKITATAGFQTLIAEGYGVDVIALGIAPKPKSDTLTVLSKNSTENGNGNGKGNGTGSGNGNGDGTGSGNGNGDGNSNGNDIADILGNAQIADAIGNLTESEKNNPLQNLQTGGGGGSGKNQKAYEVTMNNTQIPTNSLGMYILAILLLIGLLAAGYFYGIKRDE